MDYIRELNFRVSLRSSKYQLFKGKANFLTNHILGYISSNMKEIKTQQNLNSILEFLKEFGFGINLIEKDLNETVAHLSLNNFSQYQF